MDEILNFEKAQLGNLTLSPTMDNHHSEEEEDFSDLVFNSDSWKTIFEPVRTFLSLRVYSVSFGLSKTILGHVRSVALD